MYGHKLTSIWNRSRWQCHDLSRCDQQLGWFIYRQENSHKNSGFTLVEVIVALLVSAIFTSVTMQALVTAAAFRAKAAQYDESFSWIQDDLEAVVSQAHLYAMDAVPYSADCGATDPAFGVASRFITSGLGGTTTDLGTRDFGGKTFLLARTANIAASDPMRLVELTYTVTEQNTSNIISTITSEVIPQAVLRCP